MFVRAYLRASTDEQDANRARDQLNAFAAERSLTIAAWYVENESGTKLARPELFRLLQDSRPGDVLLIHEEAWEVQPVALRHQTGELEMIVPAQGGLLRSTCRRAVATTGNGDEFTARMFDAINGHVAREALAAVARKDYDDRRRRQMQGQAKAMAAGLYRGRPEDAERLASIAQLLKAGLSYTAVQNATGCSRGTVAKVARRIQGDRPFVVAA
jgi:DNA invertase Pin-like site-specific DNA recombinase